LRAGDHTRVSSGLIHSVPNRDIYGRWSHNGQTRTAQGWPTGCLWPFLLADSGRGCPLQTNRSSFVALGLPAIADEAILTLVVFVGLVLFGGYALAWVIVRPLQNAAIDVENPYSLGIRRSSRFRHFWMQCYQTWAWLQSSALPTLFSRHSCSGRFWLSFLSTCCEKCSQSIAPNTSSVDRLINVCVNTFYEYANDEFANDPGMPENYRLRVNLYALLNPNPKRCHVIRAPRYAGFMATMTCESPNTWGTQVWHSRRPRRVL